MGKCQVVEGGGAGSKAVSKGAKGANSGKCGVRKKACAKNSGISSGSHTDSSVSSGGEEPANPQRKVKKPQPHSIEVLIELKTQRGKAKNEEERQLRKAAVLARKEMKRSARRREYADMVEELRQTLAPYDHAKKLSQTNLFRLAADFLLSPEQLEAARHLEAKEPEKEDLSTLWESVETVGVLLTPDGEITQALPSTINCLGVPAGGFIGRSIVEFIASPDRDLFRSVLARMEEEQRVVFHCHMVDQRGDDWMSLHQSSTSYRRMRASLKQLPGHGGDDAEEPLLLFWACPDEELSSPHSTELSLHSRCDSTLGGTVPPYEIFSLHKPDTTFLHMCIGNLSGNRLGIPPTNPLYYNAYQQLHPQDAQNLLYFVKDNLSQTRNHRFWARSLTGHNTWAYLELVAKPCINRKTNQIEYIINKAIVTDEIGTTYEPPPSANPNEYLGINPVYFDSVGELTGLVEGLALESRQQFFKRQYERIQGKEEESILSELQRYKTQNQHHAAPAPAPSLPLPPPFPMPVLPPVNAPLYQSLPSTNIHPPYPLLMPTSAHLPFPVPAPPANLTAPLSSDSSQSLDLGLLNSASLSSLPMPTSNSRPMPTSNSSSPTGMQPMMGAATMPPMLPMLTPSNMPMLGLTNSVVPPAFLQNISPLGLQPQPQSPADPHEMNIRYGMMRL